MARREPGGERDAAGHDGAIDALRRVETPEGVELTLRIAGLPARGAAALIDLCVRAVAVVLLLVVLTRFGDAGTGAWLVVLFLIEWFYPTAFEIWSRGATPGKRLIGLRVVHADGTEVSLAASLLRNVLRAVDFLPMAYAACAVAMLLDRDFRRLGDLAAGTLVVHDPRPDPAEPIADGPARRVTLQLSIDQQRAVQAFAARCPSLSPARQQELAAILTPCLEAAGVDARGPEQVEALLAIARWLRARR